jgi:hypothetical protein
MNNAVAFQSETCFDCHGSLPADARYDICERCIDAEREREADKRSCADRLFFNGCVCNQHGEVR